MSAKKSKRDARHVELLAAAREMLINNGLVGFGIDQLAKWTGYSRPTVYTHFGSRQDVLDALAVKNLEVTRNLIQRAAEFEGTAREQAFAMILAYEVMARFHTAEFQVTQLLGMPWVREMLPSKITEASVALVKFHSASVATQVERAVTAGELNLRPELSVGQIVFHSVSMSQSAYGSIVKDRIPSDSLDPWADSRISLHCYWDGIGWEGSSREIDYADVTDRILKESFPDQWIQIELEKIRRRAGLDKDLVAAGSGVDAE